MLVIKFGSCYLELKLEMMKTQTTEMDENRSVSVWNQNLLGPFGSVSVSFLQELETGAVSFGALFSWIWTGSMSVGIQGLRGWLRAGT